MRRGLYLKDPYLFLKCDFEEKERCKGILGGTWDKQTKCWRYPRAAAWDILKAFPDVPPSPGTARWMRQFRDRVQRNQQIKTDENIDAGPEWFYSHQRRAYALISQNKHFALYMDMGTGKTVVMVNWISDNPDVRVLVVTRVALIYSAWLDDIKQFFPWLEGSCIPWQGAGRKKKYERMIRSGCNSRIILTNFATYRNDFEFLRAIGCQAMIVDESAIMKNAKTQTTKLLRKHSEQPEVKYKYIMSGCPAPNSPLEYHQQMAFLDPGLLGKSFYKFRIQWAHQADRMGYKWEIPKDNEKKMMDRIKAVSYIVSKDDCLDLPERTFTKLKVDMVPKQEKAYRQMLTQLVIQYEHGEIEAQQAVTQLMKLRQVTSGFAYHDSKDPAWLGSKKYDILKETLEDLGNEQVLIWHHFREEARRIQKTIGEENSFVYSEGTDKEKRDALAQFKEGGLRYLIAHPASIGHGVTLVNARYAIYFSVSSSYEQYSQSIDRIYRSGQKRKTQVFFLLCKMTIDDEIYACLNSKKNVSDMGLSFLKGWAK